MKNLHHYKFDKLLQCCWICITRTRECPRRNQTQFHVCVHDCLNQFNSRDLHRSTYPWNQRSVSYAPNSSKHLLTSYWPRLSGVSVPYSFSLFLQCSLAKFSSVRRCRDQSVAHCWPAPIVANNLSCTADRRSRATCYTLLTGVKRQMSVAT